jgi:hypothetical protein
MQWAKPGVLQCHDRINRDKVVVVLVDRECQPHHSLEIIGSNPISPQVVEVAACR